VKNWLDEEGDKGRRYKGVYVHIPGEHRLTLSHAVDQWQAYSRAEMSKEMEDWEHRTSVSAPKLVVKPNPVYWVQ